NYSNGGTVRHISALVFLALLASCDRAPTQTAAAAQPAPAQETPRSQREIRLTGIVEAIHSYKVTVPQIVGGSGSLTLTHLVPNGLAVKEGDVIAEFDPTQQLDAAFNAKARYEDL